MVMVVASFYVALIVLAGVGMIEVYRHWKNDSKNKLEIQSKPVLSITE
jgi:hypothetical protein